MKNTMCLLLTLMSFVSAISQNPQRKEIPLPSVNGYEVITGDFHMHTVFSDGNVWPTVRVDEAWNEGIDAIAISDHLEYVPHKDYLSVNHNAAFEICGEYAKQRNVILIRGTEITRDMPPGHFNAIFINDASKIETKQVSDFHTGQRKERNFDDYMDALNAALDQNAFIFWNHPGWTAQAPDGIKLWPIHIELIEKGIIKGIEIANWDFWYPEAFEWALKYNLTMFSNSDMHQPVGEYLGKTGQTHRPLTLLMVKERSPEGIRDALENGRTIVWFQDKIMGKKEFVEPLFLNSMEIKKPHFSDEKGNKWLEIKNSSGLDYVIQRIGADDFQKLSAYNTMLELLKSDENEIEVEVKNVLVNSKDCLKTKIKPGD